MKLPSAASPKISKVGSASGALNLGIFFCNKDITKRGGIPPPLSLGWLSLLTTHLNYPVRSFSFSHDTSAATALAAKHTTDLWSDYPALWLETIRGLYVSSARWNAQMRSHLPAHPLKGDHARTFQRYGYGVPDLARGRRGASNALTLISQDEIVPYGISAETGGDVHNEMRLLDLPWPIETLRKLWKTEVTLSSLVAPNPSEASRGSRYPYASHNLRLKLNRANEKAAQFMARISKAADQTLLEGGEEDLWAFGRDRRDVGSLHIDQITCRASDLARRNLLAVHPVAGWKAKKHL